VYEFADEGTDQVQTYLTSYTLSANVEELVFIGIWAHTGTGNRLSNDFTGGSGDDVFTGAGGNDFYDYTSTRGNGADTITDFDANTITDGHDFINLRGRGLSFGQLSLTAVDDGTLIGIPGGDSIFLQNVSISLVDRSDFFF
jgi:hypothetical protein